MANDNCRYIIKEHNFNINIINVLIDFMLLIFFMLLYFDFIDFDDCRYSLIILHINIDTMIIQ